MSRERKQVKLDGEVWMWLRELSAESGAEVEQLIAAMLFDLMRDDVEAHAAAHTRH